MDDFSSWKRKLFHASTRCSSRPYAAVFSPRPFGGVVHYAFTVQLWCVGRKSTDDVVTNSTQTTPTRSVVNICLGRTLAVMAKVIRASSNNGQFKFSTQRNKGSKRSLYKHISYDAWLQSWTCVHYTSWLTGLRGLSSLSLDPDLAAGVRLELEVELEASLGQSMSFRDPRLLLLVCRDGGGDRMWGSLLYL